MIIVSILGWLALNTLIIYVYYSITEWFVHKFLLHKPSPLSKLHTYHHKTYPRGRFTKPKDLKGKYVSLVVCLEHIFALSILPSLVAMLWSPALSLGFIVFGFTHYFLYNHIHSAQHLGSAVWPWLPRSYVKLCWFVHYLHHNNPTAWFNVSLPGADWLLGTAPKLSNYDRENWKKVESKMFPVQDLKAEQQDKEIIKSLNDCIFPSKYSDVGFVGPAPEGRADKAGQVISNLLVNTFVGDTQICYIGAQYPEVAVYAFSHRKWADVFVIRKYFPKIRLAAAQSVMQFMGGLLGLILGPLNGCFAVAPGKGVAVKTAVKLLKSKESIGICPEAWAYMDDAPLRPFQNGAVRMAAGAGVPIVPVYIKYGSYAPKCFNKLPFVLQVVLNCLDPFQRSTAFIVVGEPYSLPADCDVAEETLKLYDKVSSLEPRM